MDPRAFDGLTRKLASSASRRTAVRAAAGGMLASALALLPFRADAEVTTAAENDAICRGNGEQCRRDTQCCSFRCANGTCKCANKGAICIKDRGCCSGRCTRQGKCA